MQRVREKQERNEEDRKRRGKKDKVKRKEENAIVANKTMWFGGLRT